MGSRVTGPDLCSRGEHSDLCTLLLFQQQDCLSKTTGQKQNSTKDPFHFPPALKGLWDRTQPSATALAHVPALEQSLCQPLTRLPTGIHRLAQTGMRGAPTRSNNDQISNSCVQNPLAQLAPVIVHFLAGVRVSKALPIIFLKMNFQQYFNQRNVATSQHFTAGSQ